MIRVALEFDDQRWTRWELETRIMNSDAYHAADRVMIEESHGAQLKDRVSMENHGRQW